MNSYISERDKPLILVVDDELVGRLYIEKALQREGYDVVLAENGQQAIEVVAEQEPDMVIMDVMMPLMGGYEACRVIRKGENEIHIPILMLTGLDDVESVEESFSAGATDFVVKPVNLPIFKQRVGYGITAYKADVVLHKQKQRLRQAQIIARMGYWDWDIESNATYWSDEVYKILSVPVDENKCSYYAFLEKIHPDDRENVKQAVKNSLKNGTPYSVEHRVTRGDGELQVVSQHAELVKDSSGKVIRMSGIIQDVTEKYLAQEKLHYLAYYDSLTKLPNRVMFRDRLGQALASSREVALLVVDLDRFKNINDSLGHDIGDEFLVVIARELEEAVGASGLLGRLGGSKFSFLLKNGEIDTAIECANEILNTLSKAFDIKGHELICTGSIGITISSADSREIEVLIRQADQAMYEAKSNGGNSCVLYNARMQSRAYKMLTIERELRKAVLADELVLYYQPKCSVESGKIKGMEALIRWRHPEKGLVPPNDFIFVAEETGLIVPIGKWVLEEACKQIAKWHQQGFNELTVSVNVSVRQFHHKNFFDEVMEAVKMAGIVPRYLDLEITESCTMNDFKKAAILLERFREKGISISMDDFGTGFSSLSFLQKLPLDTLKVDRAFIKDIGANGANGELAKLIIAVAKELKLSVVAEGIETQEHMDFLKECGCDEFQGYLMSPPVPSEQFEALLINNK